MESLPDVDRTTEEQDDEIEELKAQIASLRGVIADFGRRAGTQQTLEDDKMDVGVWSISIYRINECEPRIEALQWAEYKDCRHKRNITPSLEDTSRVKEAYKSALLSTRLS